MRFTRNFVRRSTRPRAAPEILNVADTCGKSYKNGGFKTRKRKRSEADSSGVNKSKNTTADDVFSEKIVLTKTYVNQASFMKEES